MRQVFLDTETTGLSHDAGDRVIEIGCVELYNRRLTGKNLHVYVNPGRPSSFEALQVHGLTDEFLADKPLFEHVVDELLAYLNGAEIVIHNAAFDVGFLNSELRRTGHPPLHHHIARVTDSLLMARTAFPGKSNSLDALCKRFEVDNSTRELHGALLDAGLLAEVYVRMTRGQESLVIEGAEAFAAELAATSVDFSQLPLVILEATEHELMAHAKVLAEINEASRGRAVWRSPPN